MSTSEDQLFIVTVLHICEDDNSESSKSIVFLILYSPHWFAKSMPKTETNSTHNTSELIKDKNQNVNISLYKDQIHLPKTENNKFQEPPMDAPEHP